MRASFKRDENVCFYVQSPDVYKSKNSDIPSIQNQAATTSLGENNALAALKAKMEKGE